jgi:predicted ATPase
MRPANTALRFTRVHLENWRNFTRVEVEIGRRALLTGPNASGKSNLLDAFLFLGDVASAGFQQAVARRGGVPRLRSLAARQPSSIVIAVRIAPQAGAPMWEYELEFADGNGRRPSILRERVARDGNDVFLRPEAEDGTDAERLSQSYLEHAAVNRECREAAAFFASVRSVNVVPELVRDRARPAGRRGDPFGGDLIERIAATPENTRTSRLKRILKALRAAAPQLRDLQLWRDPRGAPHLRARCGDWRPQGGWQTEDQFSDGTLRLIGILWAALDSGGPLLIEEPELSLHPEIARQLLPMLASIERRTGRQMLISTHSHELLGAEGLSPGEVLLLAPGEECTEVRAAAAMDEAHALLDGTLRAVEEEAAADDAQLDLFADMPEETV